MDVRTHTQDGTISKVAYSECGAYRYSLSRCWLHAKPMVNFVMLNPSKADELRNDPTVERCERRARRLGFGGFTVTNIFAWRDTDPFAMRRADQPIGPDNDHVLLDTAATAQMVIVAWGTHGAHQTRGPQVAEMFRAAGIKMHHLGLSKHGHPKHPLYISYDQSPQVWV